MTTVKCPTCGRPVEWTGSNAFRPFCSERCRLVDLGAWIAEDRRIADPDAAAPMGEDPDREDGLPIDDR
ncbi:MAG: DNA gyrase inhibitor YacG [Gammaproteobacteria bacterium]|nr:DNA gyrase inhibitor YacG [Gammaproteobacteria bacterium]